MNNVALVGNLTRDPELRFIPNTGTAVARFSMAVNREFSKEKEVDYFNIVVWGKTAEHCANYLSKGKKVGVVGSLRNNNYEDKNGTKHYTQEINANSVEFLSPANQDQQPRQSNNQQPVNKPVNNQQDNMSGFRAIAGDDDIPF